MHSQFIKSMLLKAVKLLFIVIIYRYELKLDCMREIPNKYVMVNKDIMPSFNSQSFVSIGANTFDTNVGCSNPHDHRESLSGHFLCNGHSKVISFLSFFYFLLPIFYSISFAPETVFGYRFAPHLLYFKTP